METAGYMTVQEVADLVRVSISTVRRWVQSGELPAFKVGKRGQVRIGHADVQAFLDRQRVAPPQGGHPS